MFTRTQPTNDVDTDFVSTSFPALSKSSDPIRGPVPKIKSPSRSLIEVPVIETDDVQPSVLVIEFQSVSPIQQTTNGEHSMFERIEHNDTTTQDPNTRAVPTPSTPQSNSNDHRQTELFLNTNIVSNPTTFPSNLPVFFPPLPRISSQNLIRVSFPLIVRSLDSTTSFDAKKCPLGSILPNKE
ncbi:hypothetical protein BLNAU_22615 [Blattamonas nauphoetae]|uniref:Uncharacterized protein n=1 Tax=Blattamonas nauphoetae TaxID=2049346 RepID=A0ABQ9WSJ1_9EUKA|nr:hypothetical protein BLNAU_22615 [Blattamonas nauphoetae]